jgi:hypothetical protein
VVAPVLIRPDPFATLAARFLAPWSGAERVAPYVVTIRTGDRIVAIGDDVTIVAVVRPRLGTSPTTDDAFLVWADAAGAAHEAPMVAEPPAADGARTWRLTRPGVATSFRYRVVSGSVRSPTHAITAIDPPALLSLTARVVPPAYTKQPPITVADPARIDAWQGSEVILSFPPPAQGRAGLARPVPGREGGPGRAG